MSRRWQLLAPLLAFACAAAPMTSAPPPIPAVAAKPTCPGVDLSRDPKHCGDCDVTCDASQTCIEGNCSCLADLVSCGAHCANISRDSRDCGACGHSCNAGELCREGECECFAGTTRCEGTCTSVSSDPANCGACGRGCSGVCRDARCTVVLAAATLGAFAVGRQWIVGFRGFDIVRIPKTGGDVTKIVGALGSPREIAADATNAYYPVEAAAMIMRVPIMGGPPTPIVSAAPGVQHVALDGTTLYYAIHTDHGDTLLALSTAGGRPTTIATTKGAIRSVAASANGVVWAEYSSANDGTIRRWFNGSSEVLATALHYPSRVAFDGATVAWATDDGITMLPLGGTLRSSALPEHVSHVRSLAVDRNAVYWSSDVYAGEIPLGGIPERPTFDSGVVVADGTDVYWSRSVLVRITR